MAVEISPATTRDVEALEERLLERFRALEVRLERIITAPKQVRPGSVHDEKPDLGVEPVGARRQISASNLLHLHKAPRRDQYAARDSNPRRLLRPAKDC